MNIDDLAVAWPLKLANGTEVAKVKPAEIVRVLIPTDSHGNTYVVGLESKQEQWIATASLTLADNWTLGQPQ